MTDLLSDLRYAVRMLAKSPGFTAVAVLTLALGIGANTAIFTLIDAVMFRWMPVRDPGHLVVLRWTAHAEPRQSHTSSFGDCARTDNENPSGCSLPYPVFDLIRLKSELFSGTTAFAGPANLVLTGNGAARTASGEVVSGDYFSTLGVNAALGRTLGPEDDTLSAAPVVVLAHAFWKSAFAGERSAIGRVVVLNSVPFTIVGVTEPAFTALTPGKTQDLFLPLSTLPRLNIDWGRGDTRALDNWWLTIVARLKSGVSLQQAQAAASLTFRNQMLDGEAPLSKASDDPAIILLPAHSGLSGERQFFSKPLYILMSAVSLILLIACANVAGLSLARAAARQKEMAVRLALGGGRLRIVRQLLTESATLSLAGGALGVLLALWGVRAMTAIVLGDVNRPFPFAVQPDWRVLTFTLSVSLLSGVLVGLAPALRGTRLDLTPALKESDSTLLNYGSHARGIQSGKALVVLQVALSTIVLVGAGLLVRTLVNLRDIDPGFDTRNLLLFAIDPTLAKYDDAKIRNLYRDLQQRLSALPGVISVSYSSDTLLSGSLWTSEVHVEGQAEKAQELDTLAAGPALLETLRIPVLEGRGLVGTDFVQAARAAAFGKAPQQTAGPNGAPMAAKAPESGGPPIPVLVNREFVRQYFPDQNALGRHITQGGNSSSSGEGLAVGKPGSKTWEIVGVTGDVRYENLRREIHPMVYVPLTGGGAHFELRTSADPATLIPAVRQVVSDEDSNLPISQVRTQSQRVNELLTQERMISQLSSIFGVLALFLACIGLYGLLAYEVTRRTREIGIRVALGARGTDVFGNVLRQGLNLTLLGVIVGALGALALTRFLSSMLYGVRPADPFTFTVVAAVLTAVAFLACYVPARRAASVDPNVALRYE